MVWWACGAHVPKRPEAGGWACGAHVLKRPEAGGWACGVCVLKRPEAGRILMRLKGSQPSCGKTDIF